MPVFPSRPGLFTLDGSGIGQAAVLNEDGTLNNASNPAARGSVITLFGTGGGESAAGIEAGQVLRDVLPRAGLPVLLLFDLGSNEFQVPSRTAEVLYAGGVSGSIAGLLQINARVPANVQQTGSAVPFMLIVGSRWSVYRATISLR
jgi:uncharacterized protein (TIGR03437 family)